MDNEHDIIIVGAGPAGLSAGIYAARQGVNVLILDKKQKLGLPIRCGEATIEDVLHDFNIEPTKEIVANKVNRMKLFSSKGKKIELEIELYGYILKRDKFEQYLGKCAQDEGADIQLNTTVTGYNKTDVTITKDNGKTSEKIKGKIFIAADGVESRMGRWAGIDTALKPNDIAVCQQYLLGDIEIDKKTVEFYWGSKFSPHAYIWVFPKSDTTANVGIVSVGSLNVDLGKLLNNFIKTRAPNSKKLRFSAGCVPQAKLPKQVVKDNVVLIGDAARVAIPVTGAGIGHALTTGKWSGEISGEIISKKLDLGILNRYEEKIQNIRKKISRSYILKEKVLRDDDFYEILFALASPLPFFYKFVPELFHKFLLKGVRY